VNDPTTKAFAPAVARSRSLREQVLSVCYEAMMRGVAETVVLAERQGAYAGFVTERVTGIAEAKERLDALIRAWSIGWDLERIAPIDRVILRIGIHELIAHPEVPTPVVIAEAIRLADRFSTAESGRFVHGILAGIAGTTRGDTSRS